MYVRKCTNCVLVLSEVGLWYLLFLCYRGLNCGGLDSWAVLSFGLPEVFLCLRRDLPHLLYLRLRQIQSCAGRHRSLVCSWGDTTLTTLTRTPISTFTPTPMWIKNGYSHDYRKLGDKKDQSSNKCTYSNFLNISCTMYKPQESFSEKK